MHNAQCTMPKSFWIAYAMKCGGGVTPLSSSIFKVLHSAVCCSAAGQDFQFHQNTTWRRRNNLFSYGGWTPWDESYFISKGNLSKRLARLYSINIFSPNLRNGQCEKPMHWGNRHSEYAILGKSSQKKAAFFRTLSKSCLEPPVIKQIILKFFQTFKSWRTSKLPYWFKS